MSYVIKKWNEGNVKFEDGVVGWKMDDGEFRPLMDDAVAELLDAGLIDDVVAARTNVARNAHVEAFLADYIAHYTGPSEEEMFEARAAFGEDVEVTNIITGYTWRT